MDSALQLQKRIETLEARLAVNAQGGYRPTKFEYETEVPSVSDLRVVGTQVEGSWTGALTWVEPQNKDIAAYEIWARNVSSESSGWVKKGEVTQPPWSDTIVTDSNLTVQFSVRTKFRNGLGMTIENSPTVPVSILAPSVSITDPSQVGPNVIGDSAFLRTGGDAISITNADIVSLQATKITAGTLVAGVIYAGAIAASQITAGTISAAISITSPNIVSTNGSNVVTLTNGQIVVAGGTYTTTANNGFLTISASGSSSIHDSTAITFTNGTNSASMSAASPANIAVSSSGGSISLAGSTGNVNISGAYQVAGSSVINSSKQFVGTGGVSTSGAINTSSTYKTSGTDVINSSGAFVGAGVDVGSNGVAAAGFNISGGSHFGVTGPTTFTTVDGKTVTVRGGVITSIV